MFELTQFGRQELTFWARAWIKAFEVCVGVEVSLASIGFGALESRVGCALKMGKVGIWQRFDSYGEVSSLVIKAYALSFLLLALVLVWTLGDDLWTQYGFSSFLDTAHNNFSTVLDFSFNI